MKAMEAPLETLLASLSATFNKIDESRKSIAAASSHMATEVKPTVQSSLQAVEQPYNLVNDSNSTTAKENMATSINETTVNMQTLTGHWNVYNTSTLTLKSTVDTTLPLVKAPLEPVQSLAENVGGTCVKLAELTAPLKAVNAELTRKRCFEVEGLCMDSMCGTIDEVFKGANPSAQLQKLMQPVIDEIMAQAGIEEKVKDLVFSKVNLTNISLPSMPNVTLPELPALPNVTVATLPTVQDADSGMKLIQDIEGGMKLIQIEMVDALALIEQLVAGMVPSTTTTTTMPNLALADVTCELPQLPEVPSIPDIPGVSSAARYHTYASLGVLLLFCSRVLTPSLVAAPAGLQ
eukprot:TRINITY_DN41859_c0_g1_i2.p1 TRINITY_DN41859_c0_g1~~TRINITY_DN41859_c0_g1_i2.p1  ORF type:complete len:349 (+),score=81.73 TRINITY_DN41859_c0_g1_i2:592-1638(+)